MEAIESHYAGYVKKIEKHSQTRWYIPKISLNISKETHETVDASLAVNDDCLKLAVHFEYSSNNRWNIALSYIINHICGEGAHPLWLKKHNLWGKVKWSRGQWNRQR